MKVAQRAAFALTKASQSKRGLASSTVCPSEVSSRPTDSMACTYSLSTGSPDQACVVKAMRRLPGCVPTSTTYGRAGGTITYLSPTPEPCTASDSAAASAQTLLIGQKATRQNQD